MEANVLQGRRLWKRRIFHLIYLALQRTSSKRIDICNRNGEFSAARGKDVEVKLYSNKSACTIIGWQHWVLKFAKVPFTSPRVGTEEDIGMDSMMEQCC
ncbi:hypothetical protein IEQ34_002431 [Dendrobium chrysotoxum]|uniref:Uncharacterized protein n=1 Tax=Dendrobium chrysotoxum TaxID=161865 RepID=A0AAV7H5X9_DENCH|nr:hypothetical protein IEQ34_002431 [Dendrobium chrysotoxum]